MLTFRPHNCHSVPLELSQLSAGAMGAPSMRRAQLRNEPNWIERAIGRSSTNSTTTSASTAPRLHASTHKATLPTQGRHPEEPSELLRPIGAERPHRRRPSSLHGLNLRTPIASHLPRCAANQRPRILPAPRSMRGAAARPGAARLPTK